MVFPLDWAFLGIQDPTALAQLMAQQNVSPAALQTDLGAGAQIGALAQQQQMAQVQQVAMRPDQPVGAVAAAQQGMGVPGTADQNIIPPQGTPGMMPEPSPDTTIEQVRAVGKNADPGLVGKFMQTLQSGGLTNPHALAAVQATGMHESGFNPKNVFGTWSDPSQSGEAGTSGGALSWRAERLANLRKFGGTKDGLPPIEKQAEFFLQENPQLIEQLNNAKSPEEAQVLMNNAWRFAGYDQQGGEAASRINTAQQLAGGGSTIDFARAQGESKPTPTIAQTGDDTFTTADAVAGTTGGAAGFTEAASSAKTLADKLAAIGKGIKVPPAPETQRPPQIGGVPNMGGAAFQPAGMEELFALLGGNASGGGVPALSQLIQGMRR